MLRARQLVRQDLDQILRELRKFGRQGRTARVNYDVPSGSNLLSVQPQNFAEPPPNAIAPDRGAQRLFDAPAEPADVEAIGAEKNSEFAAGLAASRLIHRVIFRAADEPAIARKTQPRRVKRA